MMWPDARVLPLAALGLLAPVFAVASPKSLTAVLVAAGLLSLVAAFRAGERLFAGRGVTVVAVLTAGAALSCLWSGDPKAAVMTSLRLSVLALFGVHLLGAAARLDDAHRHVLGRWLAWGMGLAATLLLLEYVGPHVIGRMFHNGSAEGKSVVNNATSLVALLMGPAVYAQMRAKRFYRAGGLGLLLLAAVLVSDNTTSKFALMVGAAVFLFIYMIGVRITNWVRIIAVLVVFGGPMSTTLIPAPPDSFDAWGWRHTSLHHRLTIWRFAGGRIMEKPILGWGMDGARTLPGGEEELSLALPDGSGTVQEQLLPLHPHNAILQIWLELGVLGAAAMAALLWVVAGKAACLPDRYARAMAFASLAAATLIACSSYGLWQGWWQAALWIAAIMSSGCLRPPCLRLARTAT